MQTFVFTFNKQINAAMATITEGTATASPPTFSGNDVIVGLSGVTNQQYVTIALSNVVAADLTSGGAGAGVRGTSVPRASGRHPHVPCAVLLADAMQ